METIDIDSLTAQGYTEDVVLQKSFERRCLKRNVIFAAVFVAGLSYTVLTGKLLGLFISLGLICPILLAVWLQYRAPMIDCDTGTPMTKFKNRSSDTGVVVELVYVCEQKKTFFRRVWLRVGAEL